MSTASSAPILDLSNCDREQIQFSGAIQPHASLLAVTPEGRIEAAANTGRADGDRQLIGLPMDELFGATQAAILRKQFARIVKPAPPDRVLRAEFNGQFRNIFAHRSGSNILLEAEIDALEASLSYEQLHHRLNEGIAHLHGLSRYGEFLQSATEIIAQFTGFERVMAYRFHEDGSGEVVAETVAPGLQLYRGLHYPASDIPLPARRLFSLTWLRHLPNTQYTPISITSNIPADSLDLSYALSRSVSVMYTRYLQNMGVKSTMVLTLLRAGKLWGLISCMHHSAPRHIAYETRGACELLSHVVSLLMATKEDEASENYRRRLADQLRHLSEKLLVERDVSSALTSGAVNMLTAIDASGAALVHGHSIFTVGETPTSTVIESLVKDIDPLVKDDVWATDRLGDYTSTLASHTSKAAGLLAARLTPHTPDFALWFRPEYRHTVRWAGNPNKPVEIEVSGEEVRLSPRGSFAAWYQEVEGHSSPWQECELAHAAGVAKSIVDILLRRYRETAKLQAQLERSNRELDAFVHAASHDLQEPLRSIYLNAQLFLRSDNDQLSEEGKARISSILRLTERMNSLIEGLLTSARVDKGEIHLQEQDIRALVSEVTENLSAKFAQSDGRLIVADDLPVVRCDKLLTKVVLQNLISNALKYTDKRQPVIEVGWQRKSVPVFYVRDNGIGIDTAKHEEVFRLFRRIHRSDEYGGGTGIGLTTARSAVERHGGRIWIESELGQGTTIFFTLEPIIEDA